MAGRGSENEGLWTLGDGGGDVLSWVRAAEEDGGPDRGLRPRMGTGTGFVLEGEENRRGGGGEEERVWAMGLLLVLAAGLTGVGDRLGEGPVGIVGGEYGGTTALVVGLRARAGEEAGETKEGGTAPKVSVPVAEATGAFPATFLVNDRDVSLSSDPDSEPSRVRRSLEAEGPSKQAVEVLGLGTGEGAGDGLRELAGEALGDAFGVLLGEGSGNS